MHCVARRGRPVGTMSDPEFAMLFAARLNTALEHSVLGVSDLAHYLRRSRQQVWQWTTGDVVPNLETAARISEALGVSVDFLAGKPPREGEPT